MSTKKTQQQADFDHLVEHAKKGTIPALIIDSSDLAIKVKTLDGVITTWNLGAEHTYGYSAAEIIGKNISLLIPKNYINELKGLIKEVITGKVIPRYETKRIRKDGKIIDVSLSLSPVKDENGKIIGIVTLDRDITELIVAYQELAFQDREKGKRADELLIANKELIFQNTEKEKRAQELIIANKELAFQDKEKSKRADELLIANKELIFQNTEKEKRAQELIIANKELAFQDREKGKRADELLIANKELIFQNAEKENRAQELIIANKELAFQDREKGKRADELLIANKELIFQNAEKENRAQELIIANKELVFQDKEKEKIELANKDLEAFSLSVERASQYARSLIEASTDPLVTISAAGKITDVNEASIKVTGISREELIGTDFSDYFTEPEKARAGYKKAFEKTFVSDYPLTIRHKNGKLTDVLYNASVYRDSGGHVLGVFAAARDVTEKKKAESTLEKSLKEILGYKRAFDESSYVSITDELGLITFVNDNFCNLFQYTREELIGQDHRIINSGYHPKDFIRVMWETIQKGEIWLGEINNKAKNGANYWLDTAIVPFVDEHGAIYQYVAIRTDVTAKKLLSQYTLSLIEASRDPLITISPDGKIMDVNEAMVNATNVSREQLKGTDFKNYFTDPQKASEVYREVFSKGFVVDYPLTIKDGILIDVLFNGSTYKDDRGNVLGAVIVARDITEQKKIANELIEAKLFAEMATSVAEEAKIFAENAAKTAENAVKAKQQFLSNMSHEIRTPMNAIIGFTKVLIKTDLSAKQREYLQAIKLSGDALIVLINDILDLAKVDAGKMTFEKIPFKLSVSISAMLHLFETKIQEKNLELVKEYDERIPIVMIGDPVRLHQIILNLVSNAVKFTSKGRITVRVRMISEDPEYVTIEFSIADTGIGIAEDKISQIFEYFQQASSLTSRLYGGAGLGLAIVKQLVEPQGGKISVTSKLNEGSTFSFTLTFQKTNDEVELETDYAAFEAVNKDIKVLVVEDMALNQLLMKTLLDDFGFGYDIAANGKIAIEKLKNKVYDIILMDLQMPEMNGYEATDYIRKTIKSNIPIIALTADVTTVDLAKCKAVGMNDYIAKPVDERLLQSKILGLVKKSILTTELEKKVLQKINKYTDLGYLTRRTKSNPILMKEMIDLYLEQTPSLVLAMKQSLKDEDWNSLQTAVHKIIPSFSIVGISIDYEIMAKRVQEYASSQLQKDVIEDLVLQLETVCLQAYKELEEELTTIKYTNP